MVRPNTKLRPRIFIASRTAVRTTGSPSRPTARPSAAFQLSERSCAPSSTLPVSSSEKVAALTKDESERPSFSDQSGPDELVGDQLVGGMRVGDAQQRLGEAHHRDALVGAEIVGVKERVDARRLVRADAFHERACRRRGLAELVLRQPRLGDAFGRDLLLVRPVGAPKLGSIDRIRTGIGRPATRAARGNACTSCPNRTGMARCG